MTSSALGSVRGWMTSFFSPPGTSTRHAGPGSEPEPGLEAEPRCWHRDKESDSLLRLGHHLLVQDTAKKAGHRGRETCKG